MRYYVYTTLTNDHDYTNWTNPSDKTIYPTIESHVLIRGGANRATVKQQTPLGIRTEVTELQHEQLMRNRKFLQHMDRGFIVVTTDKNDPEEIARKEMEKADNSAPLTPNSAIFKKVARDGDDVIQPVKPMKKAEK